MILTEKQVESYLHKQVSFRGGRCIKLQSNIEEGLPDRLVILPRNIIAFCELKKPKHGRLSPMQIYQHQELRAIGCKVYVIKNYEEVDAFINELLGESGL